MHIYVMLLLLTVQLMTSQRDDKEEHRIDRYPPPWTKAELKGSEKESLLGYCVEENERCGHTEIKGGMGGVWVFCCPGLWCSPDPATSTDLYSFTKQVLTQKDLYWLYEYPYKKLICKKDDYYPPLPVDYKRDTSNDPADGSWAPKFHDEN